MARTSDRRSRGVPTASRLVWEPKDGRLARRPDELAVEEPLEIRLSGDAESTRDVLTVTMRTPGHDFELTLGWLLSEGVILSPRDVGAVRYCTDPSLDGEQRFNVVTVDLTAAAAARLAAAGGTLSRLAVTSSSCGVCGTASIEALSARGFRGVSSSVEFALSDVLTWPELLRNNGQAGFAATGGLHAAGLVSATGELLVAREDIGRHNAVDKVVGWAILEALEGRMSLPLDATGLIVSGRTSFEIVQKALGVGIPVVAAVSAASSLAARLADEHGLTLVGFVRNGHCTVYSHPERLATST
ncbi:MAG: formate dehydrogenase accessory sulfurtransferase FdhD [Acidimicrobiales bacterium]